MMMTGRFSEADRSRFFPNHDGLSRCYNIGISKGHGFTHSITIPLVCYPELTEKLGDFRDSILGENGHKPLQFKATLEDMGIDKSVFVSPNIFHMTIVMLKLKTNDCLIRAQNILKSISASVMHALDYRPVYISLKGLDYMTGSLDKTRCLYAPVEEVDHEGRLLRACHVIIDAFINAGFAQSDAKSRLKLHVSVLNAKFRRDKTKKMDINAREIYNVFGKKDWGEYPVLEAQLSKRLWFDADGYFHCHGTLMLI